MEQLTLFDDVPQRVRLSPEPMAVYVPVLVLRKRGHHVLRNGRDHKVDGRRISSAQLVLLAQLLSAPL